MARILHQEGSRLFLSHVQQPPARIDRVPAEHPVRVHRLVEAPTCPRAPVACDKRLTAQGPGTWPGRQVVMSIAPAIIPGAGTFHSSCR